MKRIGFLIEKIADMDNLRLALWKAKKAANGNADLLELRESILTGNVQVGDYHYFKIYDPKERMICAANFRERVLHHAIMNICHPIFESFQIYDSYATRPSKGQYAALERVKKWMSETGSSLYFLKLDICKFFYSINHGILFEKLSRKFKDPLLLKIFYDIIKSYSASENRGVPIGNLTSQYFANFYLAHLDHYIQNISGEKSGANSSLKYVRYMDDMIFVHQSKKVLLDIYKDVKKYCEEKLDLQLKVPVLNSVERGVPFLGYVLFPDKMRLNRNSKKRFVRKFKSYSANLQSGTWSQKEFAVHTEALFAFAKKANTLTFRRNLTLEDIL